MSAPGQPTRLGLVLKGFPRISETFISNEIRLLEERGFDIHIFSMRHPRENFTHASVRAIRAGVTYLPENMATDLPRLVWRTALLACTMPRRTAGAMRLWLSRFRLAPKKRTWCKHFLQACWLVQREARKRGITHMHAHFAHTPTTVAMYAAELLGVPFSFFAHAKDIYTQAPAALALKAARARFVVTCTDYNRRHLAALGAQDAACVRHGIDLSLFQKNGTPHAATPPYRIMTVARLVPKKGLLDVLHALALLKKKRMSFSYVLVGDGPLAPDIRAAVSDLDLTEEVQFTGTVTHEDVLNLYRQADLFVIGCITAPDGDRDGIPNVLAEAMAMGVPVAATAVSGIPELVQNGETGLLSPCADPPALAQNMQRLLTDAALRQRIIPAARQQVERIFDNRKLIAELARVYERGGITPARSGR